MKLQGRNLTMDVQGDDVRLLHRELLLIGLRQISVEEIQRGLFGPTTRAAVKEFQKAADLEVTGVVDEKTARAINEKAGTRGTGEEPPDSRLVRGHVRRAEGGALAGGIVFAVSVSTAGEVRLGQATTAGDGAYEIQYELPAGATNASLRVTVSDQTGRPLQSSDVIPQPKPVETVDLMVPGDAPEQPFRVYGAVRDEFGQPLTNVMVYAFDRDLRSEQLLGRSPAPSGHYEIRYSPAQFRKAEKRSADLVMKIAGSDGKELYKSPIHFNVADDYELDIALEGVEYKGPSQWEALTNDLMPLLEDLSPLDLREDEQHQDISFLAEESGNNRLTIGMWMAAFRLAEKTTREETPLPPEALFGFIRQGQPSIFYETLLQDIQHPDRVVLLEDKVLRGLADIIPDLQQSLLRKAIDDNIIPARVGPQTKMILETLHRIKLRYAAQVPFGGGKGTIGELLDLTPAKQQQEVFLAAFTGHTGPLDAFWKKLEKEQVLPAPTVQQVKLTFELGALTRNHIPLVAELVSQFKSGAIKEKRQLATLSADDWKRTLARTGVPANIDGDNAEKKTEQFALILEQQFERAYPTTSFGAKLQRSDRPPVRAKSGVLRFLSNNPDFQMDRYRIDHYIAGHEEAMRGIEQKDAVVSDLKSVQRLFKLNPTYKTVDTLLARKIDSAQQIYFMGQAQFVQAMANTPINAVEAKRLYRRSENAYATTLALFGQYNNAVKGIVPFGVPDQTPDPKTQAKIVALPNLQTLFGSVDYCECTYCRSVYSPAAYFVDVMRFLGQRSTQGTGINAGKDVRQVLLERRPDLGEIELSCENTNTPLPYIDLVNEILEDVVAPPTAVALDGAIEADLVAGTIRASVRDELAGKGVTAADDAIVYARDSRGQWAVRDAQHAYRIFKTGGVLKLLPTRQTFSSAAELRANPEYTNDNAYATLKTEVFPLNLPFELWYLQTRTYLEHLGVPQPRLLELFQQRLADNVTLSPSDLQIDSAWLAITETERAILTGTLAGRQPWDFWGLAQNGNNIPNPDNPADPTENVVGSWILVLGKVNVMLHRSGLTYRELLQLLDMRYVNPAGQVDILDTADENAANCDTSTFVIRNLNENVLNRMQRFIRLWRRLGCAMWEVDILLPDADPDPNVVDKRITDAALRDISQMSRLRAETGLDWRAIYSFYNTMDHNVYFDRTTDGSRVQTLYERLFRNKLVDAVASFPPGPDQIAGTIESHIPGILAALRIKEVDLDLILTDIGLLPANALDVAVLSGIYRVAALAKAIPLTVDQFLRLKRLWGQDVFASPAATRKFVRLAQQIAESDFSVLELDYLLAHRFTPNSGVALEDKTIVADLQAVRDGVQKISNNLGRTTEETQEAYVKSKLGLLPALANDSDQTIALSIIDGTWEGTLADREARIDSFFAGVLDLAVAKANLAAIPGGLDPAARQTAVDQRFAYVQPELERFLMRTQKESFVQQKIAELLEIDVPTASVLLSSLRLPASADTLLQTINDTRLLDPLAINEANFAAIFQSLRLLHKDALMIEKLDMRVPEVRWWLEGTHAADMGWMHPKDFPTDHTTQIDIGRWLAIQQFFVWKNELPKSDLTALDFATNLLDNAKPSGVNLADLATLTGWDAADIAALASAFHWVDAPAAFDVIKQELRKSANLVRLADATRALRRLGVNAARSIQWANATPDSAAADSLKQTVKAKYDLAQWQKVIQPIQDAFREQKRDALVSRLVAHPNQAQGQNWTDANGLYSYFLIDVEMSACMLTSRLKQAAASAQLFVQRCLLNLEVDILAKTDLDDRWKQWKWMKRFRVWEANRKVFLYPENWIEPELRDEKSPFFKELENELLQNDVTAETAEDAFLNYLEKLDAVANLEIRAVFNQLVSNEESVLHVIGRTRSSQSPDHYYRKRINKARWTPWEKVGLDINDGHLVAGVHNRRLFLLWPQFLEKADEQTTPISTPAANSSTSITAPSRHWEVRLFWSELKKGKWTPKVLSESFVTVSEDLAGRQTENVELRTRLAPNIQVRLYQSVNPGALAPSSDQLFNKVGRSITPLSPPTIEYIISPAESRYYNNLLRHDSATQYFYYGLISETGKPHDLNTHEHAETIRLLQKIDPARTYSAIDSQAQAFPSDGSFFVWDAARTYFVDYIWRMNYTYFSAAWHGRRIVSFRYFTHYHPFVELFIKELNIWGIRGLLNRRIQVDPASIPGSPPLVDFFTEYAPTSIVTAPLPVEDVDFTYTGAYAPYNWELFFHAPFFIANRLAANQRFEEALEWFHFIFDPTSTDTASADPDTPQQKFWITKPFFETTKADYYKQKIENIMLAIAKGDAELGAQVEEWRNHPFNPHLIARMRTVAYQKNVLIKYIQTVIAWADQLFRQDTIETMNEATQLYVLAASVLGPRPKSVPKAVPNPIKTFYQLQQEGIDEFGNALKEVENLLPSVPPLSPQRGDAPELPHLDVLYFCIPNNEKLLALWDTVTDRLFKIRHCMNIEGVVRQLPLFEPPIDPAALVRAVAAGLDVGAVLSDMSAPLPLYRFTFLIQRAQEICSEVKALGAAMLSALEKRDAEGFALLRSTHERTMLDYVRLVKLKQVDETARMYDSLVEARKVVDERRSYYVQLDHDGLNGWETTSLVLTGGAIISEIVATVLSAIAAGTAQIPSFTGGAAGFGGSPLVAVTYGGGNVSGGLSNAANVVRSVANILQMGSAMTATIGSFNRRAQEWAYQIRLADRELPQIDSQTAAATLRHEIAQQELVNHDKQKESAESESDYMQAKFSSEELYSWMIGQLSTVYFQSYQLAYDVAKRAERCFRYELGLSDSSYIQFGYWDSLKQGLLSGEKLSYDLKRLETAYYEQNRREYELTKKVSLAQLDPVALLQLRQNGECFFDVPETAFDMDYPGHYFRRLKTAALSIPCTIGPYTTVACTLTLTSNQLRKDSTLLGGKYPRDLTIEDPRFRDEIAAIQSVATSHGQNDSGTFELNFRDERYLPFEGAGAISSWHIKLNRHFSQFDFSTLSDVIIHLGYTAREGGELLRAKALEDFNKKMNDLALAEGRRGLFRIFDLKREYSDKWYRFLHPANPADDQAIVLDDLAERLPYFTRPFNVKKVRELEIVAEMKDGAMYKVLLSPLGETPADLLSLLPDPTFQGLHRAVKDLTGNEINLGTWTLKLRLGTAADFKSLPADAINELFLIINYTIAP